MRAAFEQGLGFPLDPYQREGLDAVDAGQTVLIAAPTGAGKTVIGEYAVAKALAEGVKAFYTTPIKALSNQKFGDLGRTYGSERVGLLTGDNSIRSDAPVVVMTTEVLRNMLYARSPTLDGLRFVVLDEVHYLENTGRGPVWEEVIIHTPPAVQLICLSATVSNGEQFADWLRAVRGDARAVIETKRPVELDQHYLVGDRRRPRLTLLPTFVNGKPNRRAAELDSPAASPKHRPPIPARTPRRAEVIDFLGGEDLLPAIYFSFSRAACDDAVRACRQVGLDLTTTADKLEIARIADTRCQMLTDDDRDTLGYERWLRALQSGVAAHHAGIVPPLKEAVEACFTAGLVRAVFATETLALGINMPARTVVIEQLTKFNGETHEPLRPGEYTQLTGRAGRRGIDSDGHAVVLWSRFVPFADVAALARAKTAPLVSAFRPTYNMAANLVRRYPPEEAHRVLTQSFAQFCDGDASLVHQFDRVLQLLDAWHYLDGWRLTPAGERLIGISHECDLLVAEAVADGLLDGLTPAEIAAAMSAFVYERRGPEGSGPVITFPTPALRARWSTIEGIAGDLRRSEADARLPATRALDPGFMRLAHAWAEGATLGQVLAADEMAPGDFVRVVKQLIDLLRQLAPLMADPATADACRRAGDLLRRGVVIAA